uniref:Uncharacterized protein n=1 Tax=Plectus sambesii TaxID=2011161 RepID=A0A914VJB4_9BILA
MKLFSIVSVALRLFILLLVIIAVILILTAPGVCYRRSIGSQTSYEICPNSNFLSTNILPNNNAFQPGFGVNPNNAFGASSGYPMDASRWSSQYDQHMRGDGQRVWGQVAIIVIALLVAIPAPIMGIVAMFSTKRLIATQIALIVLGLVVFLILGALETWYATGYSHMGEYISHSSLNGCILNQGIPGLSNCEVLFVVKGWAAAASLLFLSAFFSLADAVVTFATRNNKEAKMNVAPVVWTKKTTRVSI